MRNRKTNARRSSSPNRADAPAALHNFRVELPHVPPRVIERCPTPEEAFRRFKELSGIVGSDYEPTIEPTADVQTDVAADSTEETSGGRR